MSKSTASEKQATGTEENGQTSQRTTTIAREKNTRKQATARLIWPFSSTFLRNQQPNVVDVLPEHLLRLDVTLARCENNTGEIRKRQ